MNPLISIACISYNQAEYIREAIESFLIQKTNFTYEILIHDDASTDGTDQIIKEFELKYPSLIFPIYQSENQFSKGVSRILATFVFPKCCGKYIALCEGDDYWTDPHKLQKQVDFLEGNPDYTLCCGGYESFNVITNERTSVNHDDSSINSKGFTFGLEEMQEKWLTQTLTSVFRKDALIEYAANNYKYSRDDHLFYHLVKRGRGFYFNQVFGVWRKHPGGIHSMQTSKVRSISAYNCAKELFEYNGDEFTRFKYLKSTLSHLDYSLFNSYEGNSITQRIELLLTASRLARNWKEYCWVLKFFIEFILPKVIINMLKEIMKKFRS